MKKFVFLFVSVVMNCQLSNAQWTAGTPSGVYYLNSGNVGVGTDKPASKLEIVSDGSLLRLHGASFAPSTPLEIINLGLQGGTGAMNAAFRIGYPYSAGVNSGNKLDLIKVSNGNTILGTDEAGTSLGNIGIGTTAPSSKFEVGVNPPTQGIYETQKWNSGNSAYNLRLQTVWNNDGINYNFIQRFAGTEYNSLSFYYGNVGIGTTSKPDAKLAVKGDIHAQEVRVDLNGTVAPDYVFETSYKLPSLDELTAYIKLNKHLPEVPSACAMEENGVKLGEMNMILLKKVEELTLYVIEQQKEMKALKAKINLLETK